MSDTMTKTMQQDISWRDGDIYFWHYKQPRDHMPYHCCACKAIIRGGRLVDTYWGGSNDNKSWSKDDAATKLVLEFRGNLDDLERIEPWEIEYYERDDATDMSHANDTRALAYRRKGAARSQARMLELLNYKRERAASELRMAASRIEQLEVAIAQVSAGKLDGISA